MSVYFITARDVDLVKIGYADNPLRRLRELRTSSPIPLALEGAIPGGREKERELHELYAKLRMRGEWFAITSALEEEIAEASLPSKFTWACVRVWLRKLREADTAEQAMRHPVPPEVAAREETRFREALAASAHRRSLTPLQRLEADGFIHFPFRQPEPAL